MLFLCSLVALLAFARAADECQIQNAVIQEETKTKLTKALSANDASCGICGDDSKDPKEFNVKWCEDPSLTGNDGSGCFAKDEGKTATCIGYHTIADGTAPPGKNGAFCKKGSAPSTSDEKCTPWTLTTAAEGEKCGEAKCESGGCTMSGCKSGLYCATDKCKKLLAKDADCSGSNRGLCEEGLTCNEKDKCGDRYAVADGGDCKQDDHCGLGSGCTGTVGSAGVCKPYYSLGKGTKTSDPRLCSYATPYKATSGECADLDVNASCTCSCSHPTMKGIVSAVSCSAGAGVCRGLQTCECKAGGQCKDSTESTSDADKCMAGFAKKFKEAGATAETTRAWYCCQRDTLKRASIFELPDDLYKKVSCTVESENAASAAQVAVASLSLLVGLVSLFAVV